GSVQDIAVSVIEYETKVKFSRVPFSSGVEGVTALLGGHIDASISYIGEMKGYVDAGKLQPLALSGEERSSFLPNVPTWKELGYPITLGVWRIMAAPAKTPSTVIQILESAFAKALKDPITVEAFKKAGVNLMVRDSKETQRFLDNEHRFYADFVKRLGLEPE
ncbi:MAG: hypothetical protein L7F78_19210, partial [Syntrophales bacterium LBB04]|nr:hypothetical protein [Syntrophales bacterium LBB04]